jgi:hypothetical protein
MPPGLEPVVSDDSENNAAEKRAKDANGKEHGTRKARPPPVKKQIQTQFPYYDA